MYRENVKEKRTVTALKRPSSDRGIEGEKVRTGDPRGPLHV